jgi:mannose-6-phosphate isomerase-like protein (cupin superfamily)
MTTSTHQITVQLPGEATAATLTAVLHPAGAVSEPLLAAVCTTVLGFPSWADRAAALHGLAAFLLLPPLGPLPAVRRVELRLGTLSVARSGPCPPASVEDKPWGRVDVLAQTGAVELVRLVLEPGGLLPNHVHRRMLEWELVVAPGLVGWQDDGPEEPLPVGRLRRWRHGQPHGYRCPGPHPSGLLCLDAPGFDAADEVFVPRPAR